MKNYRRLLKVFIVLVMTSVFFVSCGVADYATFDGIVVRSVSNNNNTIVFKISGTDTDSDKLGDGFGLVLMYVKTTELSYSNFNSSIISKFKSTYGKSGTLGTKLTLDDPVVETTNDNTSYSLKAFTLNGSNVKPQFYHKQITVDFISSINNTISISVDNSKILLDEMTLYTKTDSNEGIYNYYVYGALIAQSSTNNKFSNIYWSDITYLGSISL